MTGSVTTEVRHQVFVSSTYLDLVDERRAIIQALLELDCIPAGMEMFPAANDDQWSLIKEVIDLSDYYVVVVGGRYGSVTPEGISYTEKEYDYALSRGIPVLGFVHGDPTSIPSGAIEIKAAARKKLDAFRAKVKQRMIKEFRTPDDLASVVSRSLIRAIKKDPRPGWVRGDRAMTDNVRAEIAELRAALAEAQKEQAELTDRTAAPEIDESFEHGTDEVTLEYSVKDLRVGRDPEVFRVKHPWDEIVALLGPFMMDEAPEAMMRKVLESNAERLYRDSEKRVGGYRLDVRVTDESWGLVMVQLRALRIIEPGIKKRAQSDRDVYWKLTPAGDKYLVGLKATKR
jgi:hypothetical protein